MAAETNLTNTACPEYEALLEDYLNGALCDANVAATAQHLEACPRCQRAADAALASTRWLREIGESLSDRPQPSPAFPRIVMARIRAAKAAQAVEGEGFWGYLVALARTFAVAATLAVALLAGYEAGWGGNPQPNLASARPTEAPYLFAPDPVTLPADEGEALVMVTESDHATY